MREDLKVFWILFVNVGFAVSAKNLNYLVRDGQLYIKPFDVFFLRSAGLPPSPRSLPACGSAKSDQGFGATGQAGFAGCRS
ncbi:MAG TPA: hypothetical protein DET40_23170 [Lentisphaeria bacterium]|nr:hypothetical protein [Lentisphaeria bacterium]